MLETSFLSLSHTHTHTHTRTHTLSHTHTYTHTHTHTYTQVKVHPITHVGHSPLAHLRRQEQLTSGYPLLSPTGITLTQAVVSLIYQLQEKEPWKSAITQVGSWKV